jgi:predicted Zn-dependent protease
MVDCAKHRVDWRTRCLTAEATLANQLQVTVVARQAVADVVIERNEARTATTDATERVRWAEADRNPLTRWPVVPPSPSQEGG